MFEKTSYINLKQDLLKTYYPYVDWKIGSKKKRISKQQDKMVNLTVVYRQLSIIW